MDVEFKQSLIEDLEEISRSKLSSIVRSCALQAIQAMTDDGKRIEALERALCHAMTTSHDTTSCVCEQCEDARLLNG